MFFTFFLFFFFNNKFKLNESDSLVACLSVFARCPIWIAQGRKVRCGGRRKNWEMKGEGWRVLLFPLSMETKAGVFLRT